MPETTASRKSTAASVCGRKTELSEGPWESQQNGKAITQPRESFEMQSKLKLFLYPFVWACKNQTGSLLTGLISPTQPTQNQQRSLFLNMNKRREVFRHKIDIMVQKKENNLRKMRMHVSGIDLLQERNDIFENICCFFFFLTNQTRHTLQNKHIWQSQKAQDLRSGIKYTKAELIITMQIVIEYNGGTNQRREQLVKLVNNYSRCQNAKIKRQKQ